MSGFSGCLEHTSIIWHQIQFAKKEGKNLYVVFFDLGNAFGSVPHSFFWAPFDFFKIPATITNLVKSHFQALQLCFILSGFATAWRLA